MSEMSSSPIRLGEWQVFPLENRLRRGARTIRLEPKVMQLLTCLTERPHSVVPREELTRLVWEDEFVSEYVLSRCVSELRKALGDDAASPRYIETIRKRGYRLVCPVSPLSETRQTLRGENPTQTRPHRFTLRGGALSAVVLLLIAAAALWLRPTFPAADSDSPAQGHWMRATSQLGSELDPAVSPDGKRLAFAWNGPSEDNFDIYVQEISGGGMLRLTKHPGEDKNPAWSPDGSQLAFVRNAGSEGGIFLVSAWGGPEAPVVRTRSGDIPDLAWSPLGDDLYFVDRSVEGPFALFSVNLQSLRRRQWTHPPADFFGDRDLALSPDNAAVAFARAELPGIEDLYLLDLGSNRERRLTRDRESIAGIAFGRDGTSILFASERDHRDWLWSISPSGGELQPVRNAGDEVYDPSFSAGLLALEKKRYEANIWEISSVGQRERLISSTRWDAFPSASPDGERIAFLSSRDGNVALWMARRDGSGAKRLSEGVVLRAAGISWVPDGTSLIFAAQYDETSRLYRLPAAGGPLVRLTDGPSHDVAPSVSGDGKWIYFGSDRSGAWQIWKMPSAGGTPVQVTRRGGIRAIVSRDGRLFAARPSSGGIWTEGEDESQDRCWVKPGQLHDWSAWDISDAGLYFVGAAQAPLLKQVLRLDLKNGAIQPVTPPMSGLAVIGLGLDFDPLRHTLLIGKVDREESDIVLWRGTERER